MRTIGIATGALALVSAFATPAFAQTSAPPGATPPGAAGERAADTGMMAKVAAPRGAFELGVEAGYTQGFGSVSRGRAVGDVARGGADVGLTAGARITPNISVAARGDLQAYGRSDALAPNVTVRGGGAGIQGTYHISPYTRLDPWVSFGVGYRALVESPQGTAPSTVTHGLELGRVEVGLDVRPSESVAVSPVIGADVNMFMWRGGGGAETAPLTNKTVSTFVFAGVKGRFDLGGAREAEPAAKVGRR